MSDSEDVVGRTVRVDVSSFRDRSVPWGPAHAVPAGESRARCGVAVDELKGPWPPSGLGAAPPCPHCLQAIG